MAMRLISTRTGVEATPEQAVLCGLAPDGGLFVPAYFPKVSMEEIESYSDMPYAQVSAAVLGRFFDAIPKEQLLGMCQRAYASFSDERVVPIRPIEDRLYAMELYHGPTLAFKDVALQILPELMAYSAQNCGDGKKILILVATSGDTGKAALEGFCDKPGTAIAVFYPDDGVSPAQRLQMATQKGENVAVFALEGDFDACQRGVKTLMSDTAFLERLDRAGYALSSANSINFGRLAPQVAYYFYAYAQLRKAGEIQKGESVDFVVPTGNFGNILAGWYAKQMGLPVGKLVCASNENNVLSRFFASGTYAAGEVLHKTTSPSMDILISSNLERLLFELTGRDGALIRQWMQAQKIGQPFTVPEEMMRRAEADFAADWASDEQGAQAIRKVFERTGFVLDTHAAVGYCAYEATRSERATVLACTASPYKFAQDVLAALGQRGEDARDASNRLAEVTHTQVPQAITDLWQARILHEDCITQGQMEEAVCGRIQA